ncbi:hypothetical protein PPTG_01859 [Phytophthora nicotianae INRA-310]|uniref:Uncharacterized protein n=2 Tax=Phytophthora nicotianae TaxID=4792 RepID=W2R8N4_PHYN3|nr:hypothetical protein PPTG_01859 [Phytophthora nicotianae INRA-310]ETN21752.1 hypothetical protein PPTG_01859 [Phytophthora nicotianae INRA-310]
MPRISNRERLRREITTSLALSEPPLIKLGASARTHLQEASDDDDETDMLLELHYVVETSRYTIPRNRRGLRSSQVPHYLYDLPSDKFLSNFRASRPAIFDIVGLIQVSWVAGICPRQPRVEKPKDFSQQ